MQLPSPRDLSSVVATRRRRCVATHWRAEEHRHRFAPARVTPTTGLPSSCAKRTFTSRISGCARFYEAASTGRWCASSVTTRMYCETMHGWWARRLIGFLINVSSCQRTRVCVCRSWSTLAPFINMFKYIFKYMFFKHTISLVIWYIKDGSISSIYICLLRSYDMLDVSSFTCTTSLSVWKFLEYFTEDNLKCTRIYFFNFKKTIPFLSKKIIKIFNISCSHNICLCFSNCNYLCLFFSLLSLRDNLIRDR